MSPSIQLTASHASMSTAYTPTSDALDRHNEYGITKNRANTRRLSTSSIGGTGGGRAWSEDEEVYLLQTRLQKMPYKHIAAHLKKTELACRLHYHQLSHGSNRRKQRTASVSSTASNSSNTGQSPIVAPASAIAAASSSGLITTTTGAIRASSLPSPIQEYTCSRREAISASPDDSSSRGGSMTPRSRSSSVLHQILPSMTTGSGAVVSSPPRLLPAILPKPTDSASSPAPERERRLSQGGSTLSQYFSGNSSEYPTTAVSHSRRAGSNGTSTAVAAAGLRLECSSLPQQLPQAPALLPPYGAGPQQASLTHAHAHHNVDMARLHAIYGTHRSVFWAAVAAEYGGGVPAAVLEDAWRSAGYSHSPSQYYHESQRQRHSEHLQQHQHRQQLPQTYSREAAPITPVASPDERECPSVVMVGAPTTTTAVAMRSGASGQRSEKGEGENPHSSNGGGGASSSDKTRISAILGIDASPRSPSERELVRRLEEEGGRRATAAVS